MKFIIKLIVMLLFISIAGCDEDVKPIKTFDNQVVKAQLDALEKAKKVDLMVQDNALKQHEKIEEITR
ncbi:MAG: hypothetical protein PHY16_04820 [Methylobacter sp.]|nr:hypothetical protein [Methylobacter sp.]